MISKSRGRKCTTVLHGGVCRRTYEGFRRKTRLSILVKLSKLIFETSALIMESTVQYYASCY